MVVGIDGCVYGMEFIGPDPTYLDTIQLITSLHKLERTMIHILTAEAEAEDMVFWEETNVFMSSALKMT